MFVKTVTQFQMNEFDSSFFKTLKQLLHDTWFFNVVPSVSCAWGDSVLPIYNRQSHLYPAGGTN